MVLRVFSSYVLPQWHTISNSLSLDERAQKIYALYQKCVSAALYLTQVRRFLGRHIRDTYFLPLPNVTDDRKPTFLKEEERYYQQFLDKNFYLDKNFPHQETIREAFTLVDQPYVITLRDGVEIIQSCPTFQHTAPSSTNSYTYVHIGGNFTTGKNNIMWFYPIMAAFIDKHKGRELPSARFILISSYELSTQTGVKWRPETLEMAGYTLAKTLEQIGKHNLTYATSLGVIYLSRALKHLPKHFISNLCLDRGPTTTVEVSKKFWHGNITSKCADEGGWSFDTESSLRNWNIIEQETSVLVIGVEHDNRFYGTANLCNSVYLKELQAHLQSTGKQAKLIILKFNSPIQLTYSRQTHHSLRLDHFTLPLLMDKTELSFFKPGENLTDAIIRTSSEETEKKESTS